MGVLKKVPKAYSGAQLNVDKSAAVKGLASTAINQAVPGAGAVFSGMDNISTKLTRDSNGIYKNKGLGALDQAFNPASLINAFSTGDSAEIGKAVLGKATLGLSNIIAPNLFGKTKRERAVEDEQKKQKMMAQQSMQMQSNSFYGALPQGGGARPFKVGGVLYKKGGILGVASKEASSVIIEGALHSEKNNLNSPELGEKGVPIVDEAGEKVAEVERDEILFTIGVTREIESHTSIYQGQKKEERSSTCLSLGKLIAKEVLENTVPSSKYKSILS